jgi:hypothetical protein
LKQVIHLLFQPIKHGHAFVATGVLHCECARKEKRNGQGYRYDNNSAFHRAFMPAEGMD